MPPSEYYVRLQHGITGGFAPPSPSAIHVVSRSKDFPDKLTVQSQVRPDGTPALTAAAPKSLVHKDNEELVDELHTILKGLPVENPPGSEDIYGLDTQIAFGSDDLEWSNGGPQGCGGGTSETKATDEDKAKFKRAVEIVKSIVDKE